MPVARQLCLIVMCWASIARAAPPATRLDELRLPGAETCPTPAALREAILVHLGYSPFREPATRVVLVRLERKDTGLVAHLSLSDGEGALLGERSLTSSSLDCRDLGDALALAISIALDPVSAARPHATTPPATAPAVPQVTPELPAPPPTHVDAASPFLLVSAGVLGALGAAPAPSLGFDLGVESRWGHFSIGLGGRADLPASAGYDGGTVTTSLLAVELVPCWQAGWFGGCLVGQLGAESASASGAGLYEPHEATALYGAVGARGVLDVPLSGVVSLRGAIELLAPLTKVVVTADSTGSPAFTASPVSGALSVGAAFRLF